MLIVELSHKLCYNIIYFCFDDRRGGIGKEI
nr:MAG TPA: hypothetical protein [Caudoviricetes sp.]